MSWIKKIAKIFYINILILIIGLFAIEAYWRVYLSSDITVTQQVLADMTIQMDTRHLYQSNNPIISYSRNMYGLRTKNFTPNGIEVLAVGGSTTDQRYIDDQEEWVSIFEAQTGLRSANAGVDGQSTYGHIKNFEKWFNKIPNLSPKYIIFYVGLNDFSKDEGYKYDRLSLPEISKDFLYYWNTSHLEYLRKLLDGIYQARKAQIGHGAVDLSTVELTSFGLIDKSLYKSLMEKKIQSYRSRLIRLASESQSMGAIPVFVTQSTAEEVFFAKKGKAFSFISDAYSVQINGIDRVNMRRILNQATMDICDDLLVKMCIDLAKELKFNLSDFYDKGHNTPSGAEKIGRYLASKFN